MMMTKTSARVSRGWGLVMVVAALGTAAILQAQAKPDQPKPEPPKAEASKPAQANPTASTQPTTTQPAGAEDRPASTTQPAAAAEGQPGAKAAADAEKAGPGGRKPKPKAVDPEPRHEPSPSEILNELKKQQGSQRPVVSPVTPGRRVVSEEAVPQNMLAAPTAKLLPDGYRIVDRPGRLVREGDYWVFSFENRGQGAPEIPIRLLPNRLLEDMERVSAGGTKPMVFIISGEVTEYHNVNYVLLQKLLTQPDVGNFK